jgi:hypothetical protein
LQPDILFLCNPWVRAKRIHGMMGGFKVYAVEVPRQKQPRKHVIVSGLDRPIKAASYLDPKVEILRIKEQ